jgi:Domain of unknown function (DUF4159)
MTRRRAIVLALLCTLLIAGGVAFGQRFGQFRRGGPPGVIPDDRNGVPDWKVDERFKKDVFTFVRVEYTSAGGRGGRRGGFGGGFGGGYGFGRGWASWATDFPDSDLNFSFRLQQLTSLKVNPNPITRKLTDPDLCDYPFLYMIEPGGLSFSEEEVKALREYLFKGGFLMVDDFWGDWQWEIFYGEIKRVFHDRDYVELGLDHDIFHCVYRLKEKPQVPSIHQWGWGGGRTWEDHGPGSETVHYRAFFDDKDRMVALICHNTDLGDGWEREGENEDYFHEFSERKSYPMGINIVTYAMTH